MPRITEIEYHEDSSRRFAALLDSPWHVFLDSGRFGGEIGRFDILAAEPYATLTTRGDETEIRTRRGVERSQDDPLALLARLLGAPSPRPVELPRHLPFAGGAIGYFAYDLGRRFERLPVIARDDVGVPDAAIGLYDWAVIVDHAERRAWLVGAGRDERTFYEWDRLVERLSPAEAPERAIGGFAVTSSVRSSFDAESYRAAFERVKAHIRAGDCYQVNLTRRFDADVTGPSWPAYLQLRRLSPAPFSAYLGLPELDVLSSSPERFLKVTGRRVETKPIKGTRPRSADPERDAALAAELRASAKDRAENVMIVDLLRNDLGRVCEAGSVAVEKLFDVESFANVHHLVSTVVGRLRADRHPLDLVRAAFPGGSITGAPKVRAMEIIEALEPERRGVYCGCIGYVGFDGDMDLNIAIRTLVRRADRLFAWAGGGVVWDSVAEAEYQEGLDKATALLAVLGAPSFT
ncbi:MAG: aminodeoxychorismate synthase component I [Gammaproteobacteria bacterium]